nr:tRNA-dihydrouridine synthase [Caviibacter abscessus]
MENLSKLDRNFLFIGNGDISSLENFNKIKNINIDGIMLARGIIGNPFLIKEIKENKKYFATLDEVKSLVLEHLELLSNDKGQTIACMQINKFLKFYFSKFNVDIKNIMLCKDISEKKKLILNI